MSDLNANDGVDGEEEEDEEDGLPQVAHRVQQGHHDDAHALHLVQRLERSEHSDGSESGDFTHARNEAEVAEHDYDEIDVVPLNTTVTGKCKMPDTGPQIHTTLVRSRRGTVRHWHKLACISQV